MVVEENNPSLSAASSHKSGIPQDKIDNIMSGISNTGTVKLNNHRKKLRQRFDIIKKLGQGTYGKVQLGINKETGQEVAIKTIKKCKIEAEADLIRIRREVQIMSSVQHPNIIHIYEVFENREKMVLVMEFAAGGELYDYLSERKVLSEEEARRVFRQISTAVYYCHKHKICHRDLKLENILLDEKGNAKIADFGLSNVFDDQKLLATFCGSPLYASPEIVRGTPYQGPEVDCWSLGVLLYTLVYGSMPFDGSNFKRLVRQISQGDYYEPKKASRASPLIRDMLTVCPEKRADIEQICRHWWVNEGYKESCLELAEALANQTPVRLDVLLSLSPISVTADQLVVPSDVTKMNDKVARSHSVGSIRCVLNTEAERKILDMVAAGGEEALMPSPTRNITQIESPQQIKRKIEETISSENCTEKLKKREKTMQDQNEIEIVQNLKTDNSYTELPDQTVEDNVTPDTNYQQPLSQCESSYMNPLISEDKTPSKVIKSFVNKHRTADLVSAINKISPEKKDYTVDKSPTFKKYKNNFAEENSNKFSTEHQQSKTNIENNTTIKVNNIKNELSLTNSYDKSPELQNKIFDKVPVTAKANNRVSEEEAIKELSPSSNSPQELISEINSSMDNFSLEDARRSMENSIALLNQARDESTKNVDNLCSKTENISVSDIKNERERKLQNAREIIGNAIQPGPPLVDDKSSNIKTSQAKITLKSATLPRRKISNADIKLDIQSNVKQPLRYLSEIKHNISGIRSAPIEENPSYKSLFNERASSLGPSESREHLITTQKPPMYSKKYQNSFRSGLSFSPKYDTPKSSNDSQANALPVSQPIKKSPREFIIPIAVEGGGFITPRAGSFESSELSKSSGNTSLGRIRKPDLFSSFFNETDSEENPSFQNSRKPAIMEGDEVEPRFSFHRLRSSRPVKKSSQDYDSQSSGEEEDDDGFEILTAENLFSTLLQRVRAVASRINVNNDITTGLPSSSRLFNNMRNTPFWSQEPFERRLNGNIAPWRHSLSRDLESDINSVFSRSGSTLPRGEYHSQKNKFS